MNWHQKLVYNNFINRKTVLTELRREWKLAYGVIAPKIWSNGQWAWLKLI